MDSLPQEAAVRRRVLGQYMTPAPAAAELVAWLQLRLFDEIKLLEPSAGQGALVRAAAAAIETIQQDAVPPIKASVTAIELDKRFASTLESSVIAPEEQISYDVKWGDFLLHRDNAIIDTPSPGPLDSSWPIDIGEDYTHVVMNPPYARIKSTSDYAQALRNMHAPSTNLYSAFISLGLRALRPGGQLVAIVPRSFCNGIQFRHLRRQIRSEASINGLRVINSRTTTFRADSVTQENVVVDLRKSVQANTICVSFSDSLKPRVQNERQVQPNEFFVSELTDAPYVLSPAPLDRKHMTRSLTTLGAQASTGSVVDFRARSYITQDAGDEKYVPLIHAYHIQDGQIKWPAAESVANYLICTEDTQKHIWPPGNYITVRRFSSKEQDRRLIIGVLAEEDDAYANGVAFENHVNVIHADRAGLSKKQASLIYKLLSEPLTDLQFRALSGSTQVNCSDLLELRF